MYQQFTLVDWSYIQRRYQFLGLIGKGRDFIFEISSTINLVRERSKTFKEDDNQDDGKGKLFALQVYNALPVDIFKKKVNQLEGAMTEWVTNLHTRIVLLGQKKINDGTFDLYVIYDVDKLVDKSLYTEIHSRKDEKAEFKLFEEKDAQELLSVLAQNILLSGRYTYEFLDITPSNILINSTNLAYHPKYVISNFGLSFYGTKFYRRYTCPTDPFFEEEVSERSVPQVIFTYAFQAALVTLQTMLGFSTKDVFKEDKLNDKHTYTFNEQFLMSLIKFITIPPPENDKDPPKDPKQEEQEKIRHELKKEKLYKRFPSISKKLVLPQISQEFSDQLRRLLTTDQSKRSLFLGLIQYPNNFFELPNPLLTGKHPWTITGVIDSKKMGTYIGMGKPHIEEEKQPGDAAKIHVSQKPQTAIQNGCGQSRWVDPENKEHNRYGNWADGKPSGLGCLELKTRKAFITGRWTSATAAEEMILYEVDKYVYFGPVDGDFLPQGEGRLIQVNPLNTPLKVTRVPVFFEGKFEKGQITEGKMWFRDGNHYEKDFKDNQPSEGTMFYKEVGHEFKGKFVNGQRSEGVLTYSNGWVFEGKFKNDHIKTGTMTYKNKAKYTGTFKKQMRHDTAGKYIYEDGVTRFEGPFLNNSMHGEGKIIYKTKEKDATGKVVEKEEVIKVEFKDGKVVDEKVIPEALHLIVLKKKDDNSELPKEDQEKKGREGEGEEV